MESDLNFGTRPSFRIFLVVVWIVIVWAGLSRPAQSDTDIIANTPEVVSVE
jgi:hypothetical protein